MKRSKKQKSLSVEIQSRNTENTCPKRNGVITRRKKVEQIEKAVNHDPVDVTSLKELAISRGGLINDELRKKGWPKLLNVNVFDIPKKPEKLLEHKYYNQVILDVNRSLKRFPPGMKDDQRTVLQDQLVNMILRILARHPELHYYQGYHDICVTFLLVVGEDLAFAIVDKLSTNHLRDFMDRTMESTSKMLNYLYPIIGTASPQLRKHMEQAELGTIFCLSWLITWFGHVLSDFRHVVRLYDFFIACHPLMPIYMAAAIVLYREKEVLACDCDMPSLHCLLSKIPQDLPYEDLISKAGALFVQYPPPMLAKESRLHYEKSHSVKNYKKLEKSTENQRPDSVLRHRKPTGKENKVQAFNRAESSWLIKLSVWTLFSAISAVIIAVYNRATGYWYPR